MTITLEQLDRATVRRIADASTAALQQVAAQFGLSVSYKTAKFADTYANFTFEFAVLAPASGAALTEGAQFFELHAELHGLKPSDLGREFLSGRERFRITGLNRDAPKYPIQATRISDGKPFKFSTHIVRVALRSAA